MSDKILDIKVNLFELLRDIDRWTAFRASAKEAVRIAAGWGLTLTEEQARNIIYVLSQYLTKTDENHLKLINGTVGGTVLLHPAMATTADPTRGVAATGSFGNGPRPHMEGWRALEFEFDLPAYMVTSLEHAIRV